NDTEIIAPNMAPNTTPTMTPIMNPTMGPTTIQSIKTKKYVSQVQEKEKRHERQSYKETNIQKSRKQDHNSTKYKKDILEDKDLEFMTSGHSDKEEP
ncbi:107_t:CDS:2, partial [Gigaspora margarita]